MNKNDINTAALDLNLITALNALLEHQSVSGAADAVGRTQSAMSHSLSRLRDHFRDPILVRDGWSMRPTPLAEQLRPLVVDAARAAFMLFEDRTDFDPARSTRRIRIMAPDLCACLFTSFIGDVSRQAPGASVEFSEGVQIRRAILNSDADIGLGFGRPRSDPNLIVHEIAPLEWCTFAPLGHTYHVNASQEAWLGSRHIVVGQSGATAGPVEKALRKQRLSRHVICYASNFSAALSLAAENDALFTTLRAPLEQMAKRLGLAACPLPFPMPDAPASLMFRNDYGDRFAIWLRQLCLKALI